MTSPDFVRLIGLGWFCALKIDFLARGLTFNPGTLDRPEWEVRAFMQHISGQLSGQLEAVFADDGLKFLTQLLGKDLGMDESKFRDLAKSMRDQASALTTDLGVSQVSTWLDNIEVARRMLKW